MKRIHQLLPLLLLLIVVNASARTPQTKKVTAKGGQIEILRDEFGTPHIFAATLEDAAFAVGYAQAEDRLEELLRNYRKAEGTMSEAFGPEWFRHDWRQRAWQHAAISRQRWNDVSPKMRACIEAYQEGIRQFMREHPEQVPKWAPELHPAQVIALGRYIIWGWPEGEAAGDLKRAGIDPDPVAYRGSNEMLLAPSKTSLKVPYAVIDPHLGWYGEFRFYEVRIYAGDFAVSGVSILGVPFPSLGHSKWCSVAMTTGGPDTSDVYEEEINPANPRQYKYDGQWREMTVRKEQIKVSDGGVMKTQEVEIEYTHHGPVVARRGGRAYAMAIPYFNEIGLTDQIYQMYTARNLTEMKKALSHLQLMAQNIMVGTTEGDIYYQRTGRVPVRPKGFDFSKPVPGNTSASEWKGIHPMEDLVQITNPPGGYMQNNNISPFAMMKDSPLVPEKYADRPYVYNDGRREPHQRAAMTLEQLHAAQNVTPEQMISIAFSPQVYKAEEWQARLKAAWEKGSSGTNGHSADATAVYNQIQNWNRRSDSDSTGALAFYAFKMSLPSKPEQTAVSVPATLTDEKLIEALDKAAQWLRSSFNSLEVPYGRYFRVGRTGGKTYPVAGGTVAEAGMATPRAISYKKTGSEMVGQGGQTSTQIVILTKTPQSFTILPLGESDHPESGHWDDQAEKLFSQGRAKSTYFLNKAELLKHVTARKTLTRGKAMAAGQ
ncbi:MAG TPA: penicillin acylase family protein [Blastocatellia bacterium]|nr:penicillin acylase family protein [Blastocatellia bacterium]